MNTKNVLEEAANESIKALFKVYVLNKRDKDKDAKAKFNRELQFIVDALEELNGPSTT